MEEKERYELFGEFGIIHDTSPNAECMLLNKFQTCEILNGQDKKIQQLKQQLAEKTLTIEQINKAFIENRSLWKDKYEQSNQDKISFAVKQLEKIRELLFEEIKQNPIIYEVTNDVVGGAVDRDRCFEIIDNQINELKGEV